MARADDPVKLEINGGAVVVHPGDTLIVCHTNPPDGLAAEIQANLPGVTVLVIPGNALAAYRRPAG